MSAYKRNHYVPEFLLKKLCGDTNSVNVYTYNAKENKLEMNIVDPSKDKCFRHFAVSKNIYNASFNISFEEKNVNIFENMLYKQILSASRALLKQYDFLLNNDMYLTDLARFILHIFVRNINFLIWLKDYLDQIPETQIYKKKGDIFGLGFQATFMTKLPDGTTILDVMYNFLKKASCNVRYIKDNKCFIHSNIILNLDKDFFLKPISKDFINEIDNLASPQEFLSKKLMLVVPLPNSLYLEFYLEDKRNINLICSDIENNLWFERYILACLNIPCSFIIYDSKLNLNNFYWIGEETAKKGIFYMLKRTHDFKNK